MTAKRNILVFLVYIIAFSFSLQNYQYTYENSTSIDFLYRTVGSRLMVDGKNPYYDKWQPHQDNPERYYHPIPRLYQKINGVTVTPSILWLNSVFAEMDFCKASDTWFYIQVSVLFVCGLLLLMSFPDFRQKMIALIAFIAFFVFSRNFYMHLHSAQVYIFYALIFCGIYALLESKLKNKYFYLGSLIMIGVWLKPFFIVLFLPFLFRRNLQVFKGGIVLGLVLLAHTIVFNHFHLWKEYVAAMPAYAEDVLFSDKKNFLQIQQPNFSVQSCIYPMKYPDKLPLTAASLRSAQYYLLKSGFTITNTSFFASASLLITILLSIITRKRKLTNKQILGLLFALYLIVELFTPAFRFGYYLVQWAAIAIIVLSSYKENIIAAILVLTGLIVNNGYIPFPDAYEGSVGEALMVLGLLQFINPFVMLSFGKSPGGIR